MKKLLWVAGVLTTLLLSMTVGIYYYLRTTIPEYDGEFVVGGISNEVEIIRDSFGMPHIYAGSDADAAFALGYCTAQDRLFQIEMMRRAIYGRLSEVLGAGTVDVDRMFRTITAAKSTDEMYAPLSDSLKLIMQAYADGVNYFLSHRRSSLPFEFSVLGITPEAWRPADELTGLYYMAWALNFSYDNELTRAAVIKKVGPEMAADIFPDYLPDSPQIMPGGEDIGAVIKKLKTIELARSLTGAPFRGASNNWVIGPAKSATGAPLLANDMHLGLTIPSIWYEAHIVTPNQNVSGVVLPGVPLIIAGANENVAWGFTNVMADDADYYLEKINPGDSSQYLFRDQWHDMTIIHDSIRVMGDSARTLDIRLTNHGPIIDDIIDLDSISDMAISMRWALVDFDGQAEALYQLNRAKNIDDVEKAAEYYKCPGQNWIYADRAGNFGYMAAVGIPRRENFDGSMLVPGWDGAHEWNGYVATNDQPHLKNPDRGWIATANSPQDKNYPYAISHAYAPPDRIARIEQLLKGKDKLSVADFEAMQADDYMLLADDWIPLFEQALSAAELNDTEKEALAEINKWNRHASLESRGTSIFLMTQVYLVDSLIHQHLGDTLAAYYLDENTFTVHKAVRLLMHKPDSPWFDNPESAAVETRDSLLVSAFKRAVAQLTEMFGDNPAKWTWDKLNKITFFHPVGRQVPFFGKILNKGPYPIGGSGNTVNPTIYRFTRAFRTMAGASQRHIFDLADIDNSRRTITTGISGNFMSPHYDDQIPMWLSHKYRPFVLSRDRVETEAKYRMKFLPSSPPPDSAAK